MRRRDSPSKIYISLTKVHMLTDGGVQCVAEDVGGAAGAREIHVCDDGPGEGAADDFIAVPAF